MAQDPIDEITARYLKQAPAPSKAAPDPIDAITAKYLQPPSINPAQDYGGGGISSLPQEPAWVDRALGPGAAERRAEFGAAANAPPLIPNDPQSQWSVEHPVRSAIASGLYNAGQMMSFGLGKRVAAKLRGVEPKDIEQQMAAAHLGARTGGLGTSLLEAGVGSTGLILPGTMTKKLIPEGASLLRQIVTSGGVYGGQRALQGLGEGEDAATATKEGLRAGVVGSTLPIVGHAISYPISKIPGVSDRVAQIVGQSAAGYGYGAASAPEGERNLQGATDAVMMGLMGGLTYRPKAGARPLSAAERLLETAKVEEKGRRKNFGSEMFSPRYTDLMKTAPDVFEAATKAASVRDAAESIGELQGQEMKKVLKNPKDHEAFMRQMISDQAWGLKQQGREPKDFLSVGGNRREFPDALALYDKHMQDVAKYASDTDTGLGEARRPVPEGGRYMHLSRVSTAEARRLEGLARVGKAEGRETVLAEPGVKEPTSHPQGGGGPLSMRGLFSKMGAAKMASGRGEAYSLDYTDVRKSTIRDQLYSATHNQLRDAVRKYAYPVQEGEKPPLEVKFGGKNERLVAVDLGKDPLWRTAQLADETGSTPVEKPANIVYVPRSVAKAWQDHVVPPETLKLPGGFDKAANAATRVALIQGGEAVRHFTNLMGALSTTPGIAKTPLQKAISLTGVGRIIPAMREAFSVKDANWNDDLISGIMHGAIRGNHFGEYGGFEDRLPVLGSLKKAVFGPSGAEARARVAMYRTLRRVDPEMTEAEAWNRVNNELGTYVSALAPKAANVLAGTGIDPFARAGVGLGKAALKTLAGVSPTGGFSMERALIAPSTVMTWAVLHKMMDEEHRWPWDAGTKFGSLPVGGSEVPFLDVLSNSVWRGMSMTGLRGAADSIISGDRKSGEIVGDAARGAANSVVGRLGPIPRSLSVLVSSLKNQGKGELPIFGSPPIGHTDAVHPIRQSLKNAARTIFPQADDYLRPQEQPELAAESDAIRAARAIGDFFGYQTHPIRDEKQRISSQQKGREAVGYAAVDDIMYETRAISDPTERMKKAVDLLHQRVEGPQLLPLARILAARIRGAPRSTEKAYRRATEGEK